MPKPKPPIIKGPARQDLIKIAKETELQWGGAQRDRYLGKLEARIKTLAYTPKMGPERRELGGGRRVVTVGKHLVVYRVIDGRPEISRVLHASMDLNRELRRGRSRDLDIER